MRTAAVVLRMCQRQHLYTRPETPHKGLGDVPDGGGGRVLLELNILLKIKGRGEG